MINVLVAGTPFGLQGCDPEERWLTDTHRQVLEAISPDIQIEHLSTRELHNGASPDNPPEVILLESAGASDAYEDLPGLVHRRALPAIFTDSLRWVHACAAGVDHLLPVVPDSVTLSNASGVHAAAIAETVLAAVLSHSKQFDARRDNQTREEWTALDCNELGGATVCVIGVGRIGAQIARLCKAFDTRVVGVARSARKLENFDVVYPQSHLADALAGADYVVVACPLTEQTRGLLGAAELKLLGRQAYIINVARGPILDEAELLRAVNAGAIAGAFLDAFTEEPLPAGRPFWSVPGIRVSPHDSHSSQRIGDNQIKLFAANLRRYVKGEDLLNVVDPRIGY